MTDEPVIDADAVDLPDTPESEAPAAPAPSTDLVAGGAAGAIIRAEDPREILSKAKQIADALKELIDSAGLAVNLDRRNPDRKHVEVGGWQAAGTMLGALGGQPLHAETIWTRRVLGDDGQPHRTTYTATVKRYHSKQQGGGLREEITYDVDGYDWEACVEIRTPAGVVVGRAEAMVSRAESTWAKRDDYALRSMAECVPLRTRILTKRGWVTHEDARVGEEVLAYDVAADRTVWTPLRAVNTFAAEPLVRMQNRSFDFTCTSDHSWAVRGETGHRSLAKARELGTRHVMLAAPAPGGEHPIAASDAELLGWIICDGTIRYDRYGAVRVHIDQSKPQHVERLRALSANGVATESVAKEAGEHTFPTGRTYATRQAHRFNLANEHARRILALAGIAGKGDVVTQVTSFSIAARRAMLRAMLAADGASKPSENGFEGGRYVFSKQAPAVFETFRLLATLEGHALGRLTGRELVTGSWQPSQTLRANRVTAARTLRHADCEPEPVWCPTTDYGTWVAEQDGNVAITGNTRAESRAYRKAIGWIVHIAGYNPTPAEEMGHTPGADTSAALAPVPDDQKADVFAALAYLLGPGTDPAPAPHPKEVAENLMAIFDGVLPQKMGLALMGVAGRKQRLTAEAQAAAASDTATGSTPMSGSVPMPDLSHLQTEKGAVDVLRAAGCICPEPMNAKTFDLACPLIDHGVPF